jgi:hypothetical protein
VEIKTGGIMNKLKFIIDMVDRVITVARLIKDAAELRKKEIEEKSESDEKEDSKEV